MQQFMNAVQTAIGHLNNARGIAQRKTAEAEAMLDQAESAVATARKALQSLNEPGAPAEKASPPAEEVVTQQPEETAGDAAPPSDAEDGENGEGPGTLPAE